MLRSSALLLLRNGNRVRLRRGHRTTRCRCELGVCARHGLSEYAPSTWRFLFCRRSNVLVRHQLGRQRRRVRQRDLAAGGNWWGIDVESHRSVW